MSPSLLLAALLAAQSAPDASPASPAASPASPAASPASPPRDPFASANSTDTQVDLKVSSFISAAGRFRLVLLYRPAGSSGQPRRIAIDRLGPVDLLLPDGSRLRFELLRADLTEIILRGPDGSVINLK